MGNARFYCCFHSSYKIKKPTHYTTRETHATHSHKPGTRCTLDRKGDTDSEMYSHTGQEAGSASKTGRLERCCSLCGIRRLRELTERPELVERHIVIGGLGFSGGGRHGFSGGGGLDGGGLNGGGVGPPLAAVDLNSLEGNCVNGLVRHGGVGPHAATLSQQ